jgi:putative tryptophan/tyrosine transport system permease protein
MKMYDLFIKGLIQGLILSLVAYAVMIPFRLLRSPDLTAEGAYPLGGALGAATLLAGYSAYTAVFIALVGGGLLGAMVSLVHIRLNINTLLAGIILTTMVYSINLRILMQPNAALFEVSNFFDSNDTHTLQVLITALTLFAVPFALVMKTKQGLALRAVGINPYFAKKQGISIGYYKTLGLCISGAISALAGCLMIQMQHYMDVGMGVGMVIHALAALMIGEVILDNNSVTKQLLAPIVGALLYQQIFGVALSCGLRPSDLKCFTGALVLAVIALRKGENHGVE